MMTIMIMWSTHAMQGRHRLERGNTNCEMQQTHAHSPMYVYTGISKSSSCSTRAGCTTSRQKRREKGKLRDWSFISTPPPPTTTHTAVLYVITVSHDQSERKRFFLTHQWKTSFQPPFTESGPPFSAIHNPVIHVKSK